MKKIMFNDKYGLTQAVLEGRKTMTRRICKYDRPNEDYDIVFPIFEHKDYDNEGNIISPLYYAFGWKNKDGDFKGWNNPKYKIGEIIAIAQNYENAGYGGESMELMSSAGWNNKMFVRADLMPHYIKITGIKVERLQDISEEDCLEEGLIKYTKDGTVFKYDLADGYEMFSWQAMKRTPKEAFSVLIDRVSGKGTWERNPFVFAYEFTLLE